MSKKSECVKDWRRRTKSRIIKAFGGKCCICGYNKYEGALELHHLNPLSKELGIGSLRANARNWDYIVKELKKCVLVCSNCHKEIHAGYTNLPSFYAEFDDNYRESQQMDVCPVCGKLKPIRNITCSHRCAAVRSNRVNWENVDLLGMKAEGLTNVDIGEILGVSDTTIRKHLLKLEKEV